MIYPMKNLVRFPILLAFISTCYAQAVVPVNIRATNTLERLFDLDGMSYTDMLYGIPLPEGKVVGDTYLSTHWKNSTILLYEKDKLIEGYPVRYDIQLDELEIKARNGIKVLKGSKIKSFVWADSITRIPEYFVNAKDYKNEDNVPFTGFFQVLADGTHPLFKKTFIDIKKADYNIRFNVGSHDDKILKKSEFYTVKNNQVIELPAGRKKLIMLFSDKSEEMEKFMKDNDLASNKEGHLKILFDHYNTQVNN